MPSETAAVVGAAGGVGTTRLTVECAATLARTGRDVAVLDGAYATQGLVDHVEGRVETDLTTVVTDDTPLDAALYRFPVDAPGRVALAPVRAPFERIARAKRPAAAERFADRIAAAALSYDTVLVDVPPVGANQAAWGVNAAARTVLVTTDSRRGADALARMRGRLADVGASVDAVVANFADDEPVVESADARVPRAEPDSDLSAVPSCLPPDGRFAPAVADAAGAALGTALDLEFPEGGRLRSVLGGDSS
ncbi:MAG: MinD/ParA family protein [Salinirussus sp.]